MEMLQASVDEPKWDPCLRWLVNLIGIEKILERSKSTIDYFPRLKRRSETS